MISMRLWQAVEKAAAVGQQDCTRLSFAIAPFSIQCPNIVLCSLAEKQAALISIGYLTLPRMQSSSQRREINDSQRTIPCVLMPPLLDPLLVAGGGAHGLQSEKLHDLDRPSGLPGRSTFAPILTGERVMLHPWPALLAGLCSVPVSCFCGKCAFCPAQALASRRHDPSVIYRLMEHMKMTEKGRRSSFIRPFAVALFPSSPPPGPGSNHHLIGTQKCSTITSESQPLPRLIGAFLFSLHIVRAPRPFRRFRRTSGPSFWRPCSSTPPSRTTRSTTPVAIPTTIARSAPQNAETQQGARAALLHVPPLTPFPFQNCCAPRLSWSWAPTCDAFSDAVTGQS